MINYKLTRSNRKTIAIHVRDGAVEVRAPHRTPKQNIDRFVLSKEKWINDTLAKSNARAEQRGNFSVTYGDYVTYRGKKYPIIPKPGDMVGFDDKCFYVPPGLTPEEVKHACIQIYRLLAENHLNERALKFVGEMVVLPSAIKINSAKTRWGSCSSKNSVNFSWLLIMADDDIIDYVIVHEFAHIIEMNHSARFWAVVESVLPDYADRKERLKDLQRRLSVEDWG